MKSPRAVRYTDHLIFNNANSIIANMFVGNKIMLKKGGSRWVEGVNFFDREHELKVLDKRVRDGTHTLLTAQRRMGKTSLVRELLRRLRETGDLEVVFIDVQAAIDTADMIAELSARARSVQGAWGRIKSSFANTLKGVDSRIEELSFSDLKVKLRAGIDTGNWLQQGDAVFSALASNERPVVLAIDELPILVNRMLKDDNGRIIPEGKRETEAFLSWLRRNGQEHQGRVSIIVSGSVGLEPILEQAALSAHANIFSPFDLEPWSEEIATLCLKELADSYDITLPLEVRQSICKRLRCCIPHHVQMFFDKLHIHLENENQQEASREDVEWVYLHEVLSVRGQMDLQHYEGRLRTMLGTTGYPIALEILTHTAVKGSLDDETVSRYKRYFSAQDGDGDPSVTHVLHVLHHDGYLERTEDCASRFVSGLLEDWWRSRYGQNFVSIVGS